MRSYAISPFYKVARDASRELAPSVQNQYLDLVVGLFMRTLTKVYSSETLTKADEAKLRKYLDRIIEAKGSITQAEI